MSRLAYKSLADEEPSLVPTPFPRAFPRYSQTTLGYKDQIATILSLNGAIIQEKLPARPYRSAILDHVAGQPLALKMQYNWRM